MGGGSGGKHGRHLRGGKRHRTDRYLYRRLYMPVAGIAARSALSLYHSTRGSALATRASGLAPSGTAACGRYRGGVLLPAAAARSRARLRRLFTAAADANTLRIFARKHLGERQRYRCGEAPKLWRCFRTPRALRIRRTRAWHAVRLFFLAARHGVQKEGKALAAQRSELSAETQKGRRMRGISRTRPANVATKRCA